MANFIINKKLEYYDIFVRKICSWMMCFNIIALAAYYPLDGDFRDSSGLGHDGMPVNPTNPPQFSMMDFAVNTSAVFTGMC